MDWCPADSGNYYGTQILTYTVGGNSVLFTRGKKDGNKWGEWVKYASTADLAFTKAENPVINTAIVKPTDSTVIYKNGNIAYINFNFDIVDSLPSLTGRERLLSNLPVEKTTCYLYIKAFNSQSMQRCEIYNGTLMLLYENRLEAGKTYNGVIMYPLK